MQKKRKSYWYIKCLNVSQAWMNMFNSCVFLVGHWDLSLSLTGVWRWNPKGSDLGCFEHEIRRAREALFEICFFFLTAFRWNGELFDVFFSDIAAGIRGGGFLSWLFLFTLRQAEMLEMMKDLSIWQIRLDGLKPPPRIACVVLHEVVEEMCSFIAGAEESTTSNPAWKNWRMTIKVASISWIYPPPRIPVAN